MISSITPEQFAAQMTDWRELAQQPDARVPLDGFTLETAGSAVTYRTIGGFMIDNRFTPQEGGDPQRLFYAAPNTAHPKVDAPFVMLPVGPAQTAAEKPAGQHGWPRWARHEVEGPRSESESGEVWISTRTVVPPEADTILTRSFLLAPSSLAVDSFVQARRPHDISFGHHDFYGGDFGGATVNGQNLDDLLKEKGAEQAIMDGEFRHWEGFGEECSVVEVQRRDGLAFTIEADAQCRFDPLPVTLRFWHRPGTHSLAIEPTVGVQRRRDGTLEERAQYIDASADIRLHVASTLLRGPQTAA